VPVENVLGEVGQGHRIAFNILNVGRFKLGAGSADRQGVPADRSRLRRSAQAVRQPIASFGMIQGSSPTWRLASTSRQHELSHRRLMTTPPMRST